VRSLLRFLIMVFLSMGVWMAIGLGVGFLLHRPVPAIDLGMGTLIGVVTLGGCFLWLSRISSLEAGVSANLLHGFERFNLQNLVSFPGPWRVECPHTSMPGGSTL
jgi:hypothetical protein